MITTQEKCKVLIVFDDMTVDIISNKKLNPIVTEPFISSRKLNLSLVCLFLHNHTSQYQKIKILN